MTGDWHEPAYPARVPADAPIVPNDQWADKADRVPKRCGVLHRRHLWTMPEPAIHRWVCARCGAASYRTPGRRWRSA